MHKTTVKILPNRRKKWAIQLSKQVRSLLLDYDYTIESKKSKTDYTICIGGDGTIMYYNHLNLLSGKIIGIGGEHSVVAQLKRDEWKHIINYMEHGKCKYLHKLSAKINNREYTAINDVVLHSKTFRVVRFNLSVDKVNYSFLADGIIVSTPVGSTAYAYSAGGEILPLSSKLNTIVAVAPYMRLFEHMETSKLIHISTSEKCALMIDGIRIGDADNIRIKSSKRWCYLLV